MEITSATKSATASPPRLSGRLSSPASGQSARTRHSAPGSRRKAALFWLAGLVVCVAAVLYSIKYVDRPVADYFDLTVRLTPLWQWLMLLLKPFMLIVVAAFFFLLACAGRLLGGRALPPWTSTPLRCSWAAVIGVAVERILKLIFGRPGPDPVYLRFHRYGFDWLDATYRWTSFPSGTAIVAAGIVTVLWNLRPKLRIPAIVLAIPLLASVIVTNWHWVSDVIAGTYLGIFIGWLTVKVRGADITRVLASRANHRVREGR